ncbi:hypothetical protein GGR52DRAFT_520278 [Hypoxylon sp. FL1284]|nr:hypothetical protein GGR52DRAFT_520278 [Hypoxylon sp. FL1284]
MHLYQRIIVPSSETGQVNKIEAQIVALSNGGLNMILECAFLFVLTTLWTALRFWSRRLRGVGFYLEDWLHLSAVVFFYGMISTCIFCVFGGGAGYHVDELQDWHIIRFSKSYFLTEIFYSLSIGLVKISIAVMIMRIFVTPTVRIVGICVLVYSVLWIIHPLFTGLLVCKPIAMNWNPETPGGSCGNQYIGFGIVAALDIINELCLLILPIPSLLKLHLNRRYKVSLAAVFCTGVITLVVAILRIPLLLKTDFSDLTYDTRSQMVALAEPGVAIIVSCSPLLKPLYDRAIAFFADKNTTRGPQGLGMLAKHSIQNLRLPKKTIMWIHTQFSSSNDVLEMDTIGSPYRNRDLEILATGRPSAEAAEHEGDGISSALRIVVVKEAIVSRGDIEATA